MTKKMKKDLKKIIISILLLIPALLISSKIKIILFLCSYIVVGYNIIIKAFKNIKRGKVFDENFLMTVATLGALLIGELPEAVTVMLFYQIGELFQSYAVGKSRNSVIELMSIKPDYANVIREDKLQKISPEEVEVGEIIEIKPGEKIPLDGIITEGETQLNTFAITGESVPRLAKVKDEVISGCINTECKIKVKVTKKFKESTVNKILELVENASSRKSKSENFITKFAKYYTPIVVICALLLAIIPPIVLNEQFNIWIYRALSFLVVSCPCALVVSIPLSFFGGIGASSKLGVLIKGSNYLEALSNTEIIVCDKTGTLTEGVFEVIEVLPQEISKEELLKYASYAECYSNHPISKSIQQAYGKKINSSKVKDIKEISGKGIKAVIGGKNVLVGNEKLMQENNIKIVKSQNIGTIIYVSINNKFSGSITISDKIKDDSYKAIELFRKENVKQIVMLSGDKEEVSKQVSEKLKLNKHHSELLPQDKVKIVEELLKEKSPKGKLVFIGDGINDAPVLALSDIGVAMGALGSDAAIEAADIVIMNDEPSRLASAIKVSQKTMKIVKENIVLAITIKILVLILSALGIVTMWAAVFADVGVSILAILNALRLLTIKQRLE